MAADEKGKGKSKASAIEIEDSDEEAAQHRSAREVSVKPASDAGLTNEAREVATSSLASLLGDRAQMERERLARQKKRRRDAGLSDDVEDILDTENSAPKRAMISSSAIDRNGERSDPISTSKIASGTKIKATSPFYWNGAIKKSYNEFSPKMPGTQFSQLLLPTTPFEANGLTHAVLATYCADIPWLARLFPKAPLQVGPQITFICLEETGMKEGAYSPMHPDMPNWVRLVVPRRGLTDYATMHMKFIVLFYQDRVRLLILSGNMVEYDWKLIENTAFIHDFPRLPKGQTDTTSEYGKQMKTVLQSLTVPPNHPAIKLLSTYDLHSKCEARIVFSLPSTRPVSGWDSIKKVGLGQLSTVVQDIMGKKVNGGLILEAQGSSMGSYSTRWLQQLHIVCSGKSMESTLPLPQGARANKAWSQAVSRSESEKWPPIKLLFPSDRWVKTQSIMGTEGAMTFFGKKKQSIERGFLDILYQPTSVRGNFMMHHKAILTLQPDADSEQDASKSVGWVYMGSHNLTQAAWGNISLPKSGKDPQCVIGNWELGVVMPVRKKDLLESQAEGESQSMAANVITWRRPVEKYSRGDVPWDQFNQ